MRAGELYEHREVEEEELMAFIHGAFLIEQMTSYLVARAVIDPLTPPTVIS